MVVSAVDKLRAQGDLLLQEIPSPGFLASAEYTQWRPIADKESVDLLECEQYLFSDSVLKLGKKGASKWESYYEEAIKWMQKETGLRMRTTHGKPFKYRWDVESGITTAGILPKIKKLIDEKAEGDPSLFTDRVIIFGCLNDFNDLKPMKDDSEPLPDKIRKVAEDTRDYIKQFRFGHFVWIGPGSEKCGSMIEETHLSGGNHEPMSSRTSSKKRDAPASPVPSLLRKGGS